MTQTSHPRRAALAATAFALLLGATGCAPLVVGTAVVGGTLIATDRRTTGAQLEDQAIELKARNRIRDAVGERASIGVTSYNRLLLLTGEAPNEADRAAIEAAAQKVENVRTVLNEVAVLGNSTLGSRSNDALLSTKVKASFVEAKDLSANAFKVVTERGTVYLLGRVTEREANRAADIARSVGGVQKVVKVFEYLTEAELAALNVPKPAAK